MIYLQNNDDINNVIDKRQEISRRAVRSLPFILTLFIIAICVSFMSDHSFEEMLNLSPDNLLTAFFALMGLYWLKSLSVVFPLTALFVAVGAIYPFGAACVINIIGLAICYTTPYLVGRFSGGKFVEEVLVKYPKAESLAVRSQRNNFLSAYVTRAIIFIPGDVVSMLHGALRMPFRSYLLGSLIGTLPQMLVQTYLGANISQLDISMVLVLLGLTAVTLLLSLPLNKKMSPQWVDADKDEFYSFDYFDEWDDGSI